MTTISTNDLISAIEDLTLGGRSLQKKIGPSEVGISCGRCLARKLAQVDKGRVVSSFRTTVGRAVHALLEEELPPLFPKDSFIAEASLSIHQYKSLDLTGSSDVFLPNDGHGKVVDWKVVGDDTLEAMRRAVAAGKPIKQQYITQGHLYGLGWERKGYTVEDVCILFLPANKGDLRRYHVAYQYRYDRSAAARALAKIEGLIDWAEVVGWESVIKAHDPEPGCLSCPTYRESDNPQTDFLFQKSAK